MTSPLPAAPDPAQRVDGREAPLRPRQGGRDRARSPSRCSPSCSRVMFSSPDVKPVTVAQWATAAPKDFLPTAVSELDGTSGVADLRAALHARRRSRAEHHRRHLDPARARRADPDRPRASAFVLGPLSIPAADEPAPRPRRSPTYRTRRRAPAAGVGERHYGEGARQRGNDPAHGRPGDTARCRC